MLQEPIKPIIEHQAYSNVLILLSQTNYNAYSLSEKINKSPQAIHKQLTYLKHTNWIKKLKKKDTSSPINYDKISKEFLNYFINQELSSKEQKKLRLNIDLIIKEGFYQILLKKFFELYAIENQYVLLKEIFNDIQYILMMWVNEKTSNQLILRELSKYKILEQTLLDNISEKIGGDLIKIFSEKYAESYKFTLLITSGLVDYRSVVLKKYTIDSIILFDKS